MFELKRLLEAFPSINVEAMEKAGLDWQTFQDIHTQFASDAGRLKGALQSVRNSVHEFDGVHSVRSRIKDDLHLVEKCIRKKLRNPERKITAETYLEEITDLVGVRAIHLYKGDWRRIHDKVMESWNMKETPTAYYRRGDSKEVIDSFAQAGCKPEEHPSGYRSVHYVLETAPTKKQVYVELQVRTIAEEAWSEVDHDVRYPYGCEPIVENFLDLFNRIAGCADELAMMIHLLEDSLVRARDDHALALKAKDEALAVLRDEAAKLGEKAQDRERMLKAIEVLRKQPMDTFGGAFSQFVGSMAMAAVSGELTRAMDDTFTKKVEGARAPPAQSTGAPKPPLPPAPQKPSKPTEKGGPKASGK